MIWQLKQKLFQNYFLAGHLLLKLAMGTVTGCQIKFHVFSEASKMCLPFKTVFFSIQKHFCKLVQTAEWFKKCKVMLLIRKMISTKSEILC